MKMVSNNCICVGRNVQSWDDGSKSYRVQVSNGDGGVMTAGCTEEIYESIVPLTKSYDLEINVDTNGYKHYIELLAIYEV